MFSVYGAIFLLLDMGNQQTLLEEVVVQSPSPGSDVKLNINRRLPSGETLLTGAIQQTNVEIVKYLIASGTDTNISNKNGETPLNIAIRSNNCDMVSAILDNPNTNINKVGRFGLAPIHIASVNADTKVIQLLLDSGADANMVCQFQNQGYQQIDISCTPLNMAILHEHVGKLLLQHGASVNIGNPLLKALTKLSVSLAAQIAEHKSLDIEKLNESPSDVLAAAARIHHCHIVRTLVKKGVHVQRIKNPHNDTFRKQICAMAYVIHYRCKDCFEFLFPYISDLNAPDTNGYTLIEYTVNKILWPCRKDDHRYCLRITEVPVRQEKPAVCTLDWIDYMKCLLVKGADLSVIWDKLVWSRASRYKKHFDEDRQGIMFCIGVYHSSQTLCTQTRFRNLGIGGDLEAMSLVYLDGYDPTEEDLLIVENKINNLSVFEMENTAFVKGKLHLLLEKPRTLKNLAVISIRRNCGPNLYKPVQELPLPEQVKQFILFGNLQGMFPSDSTCTD